MEFIERRFFQLLACLSKQEIKDLGKWLRSPFCNSIQKLVMLYDLLLPFYPDFKAEILKPQWIFKQLYPKREFSDEMLRNQLYLFKKSIMEFLSYQEWKGDKELKQKLLIQAYRRHHRIDWFRESSQKLVDQIMSKKRLNWEDYLSVLKLSEMMYYHPENVDLLEQPEPLYWADTALDQFYKLGKHRFLCEIKERGKQLKTDKSEDTKMHDQYCQKLEDSVSDAMEAYDHRLSHKDSLNDTEFQQQLESYLVRQHLYGDKDRQILFMYLLNDASRIFRNGNTEILPAIFQLFQLGFENNLLIYDERITVRSYLNMVTVGNTLKKFGEIKQFILKYTPLLAENVREDARLFATAHTLYKQGDFTAGMNTIKDHKFNSRTFIYRGRTLLLQTYFECYMEDDKMFEPFLYYAKAFENQIRADKTLETKVTTAYLKLIYYTRKLVEWNDRSGMKEQLTELKNKLVQEPLLHAVVWLREKIAALEKVERRK